MRNIEHRLQMLEARKEGAEDAFLIVVLRDGSRRRMLWAEAMQLDETDIAGIEGEGELAGLVSVFLRGDTQNSSENEGVMDYGENYG